MKQTRFLLLMLAAIVGGSTSQSLLTAAEQTFLWQIGKPDNKNAEFALAPNGYGQFKNDGFFAVGESDAAHDWPYAHPGPVDSWAGAREHTFVILFGLNSAPTSGNCKLLIDYLDVHAVNPPRVRVQVNGQKLFEQTLPKGAGDATVNGDYARGKQHVVTINVAGSILRQGDNEIRISTVAGSWLLYDWVGFQAGQGQALALTGIQSRTVVDRVQTVRALQEKDGKMMQPVLVTLRHFGGEEQASVQMEGAEPTRLALKSGEQTVELQTPAVSEETKQKVLLQVAGKVASAQIVTIKPVRKLTVYILPHSHTDIGYTEIQTAIENKQVNNLVEGIAYARQTASYPEGARFVWNVEVLWAADLYLQRLDDKANSRHFSRR